MVIKLITAAIAWTTMLCSILYVSVTDDAKVLNRQLSIIPQWVKAFFVNAHLTLLMNEDISG